MLLKGFNAKSVFGYLDFNIDFNNDVSFLIGGNGSGKTSALKLINALISPNFSELLQTPFESCAIHIKNNEKDIFISAHNEPENVVLQITGVEQRLHLPSFKNFDYFSNREDKFEEFIDDLKRENSEHPVVREITKLDSPIFLGLDRRRDMDSRKQDYYHEREMWLHNRWKKNLSAKRYIKGSIGASLMDTEMLVQNSYKRIRELENRQSHKLRDKILLSSFQVTKFEHDDLKLEINKWKEKEGLLASQKEISEALSNIVGKDSSLSTEVDKFFSDIKGLFEMMDKSKDGLVVEWLLNKAQLDRMAKLVDIIDEHKSIVDNYYKPINLFLDTINDFYSDSKKELRIDTVGQLVVQRPDGEECTIEGLSSGERQLLVIFAQAFFNHRSGKKIIFIIDEPELSLHLGWQEKFAETIFNISPNSQFILATHSPEIVAGNKNKAVRCR